MIKKHRRSGMKIKIRKDGFLELERAGKFMSQFCAVSRNLSRCGDWCPKFGEPEKDRSKGLLDLCEERTLRGEIIDERQKGRSDEK
jgi:hypothetical protein